MQKKYKATSRRAFLTATGSLAGSGWLALNAPALLAAGQAAAERREADKGWIHLSPGEARTLAAVADQIVPPDDLPGAAEIGVVHFIDQALGGFMAAEAGLLTEGVADLDRRAQAASPGVTFAGLSFERQTDLLQPLENTPFFSLMILLTHCGMFALPAWGGNRERAGWALIGFDSRHAWQPPFGYYDAQAASAEDAIG